MSRHIVRFAIALAVLAAAAPAAADTLTPESGADISEVSHAVSVTFPAPDLAELTVRRSLANAGDTAAGFLLDIELPEGAVVTSMRSRSGSRWHRAALLDAGTARKRYGRLPASAGAPDQDTVLLWFSGPRRVSLSAAAVPPRGALTVEYTLRAPAERAGGRLRTHYHHGGGEGLTAPVLTVAAPSGRAWINGAAVIAGAPRVLAPPPRSPAPSSVSSLMKLPAKLAVRSGIVRAFVSHERPGDLAVELVGPGGRRQDILGVNTANAPARLRAGIALEPAMLGPAGPAWKLVVSDRESGHGGVLHSWRLDIIDTGGERSVHRERRPVPIPDALDAPADQPATAIIEAARDPGKLAVRHGRALYAKGASSVTRLHVDAPDALSRTPDDLRVVFVIDASRSLSSEQVDGQLDVAAAYLAAAPSARFELVRFDRRARRLLGRFAAAAELPEIRARLRTSGALATANGSHLERGLAAAARALRAVGGTPRIVVLSDLLMRSRFSNAAAQKSLRRGPGSIVAHVVEARGVSGGADQRLDDHALAPIAAATGGMAIAVDPDADPEALGRSALHLVRPIRVDHFAVSEPFAAKVARAGPLYEGTGLRLAAVLDKASPAALEVRGKLWARSIDRRVVARRGDGDLAAALLFGTEDAFVGIDGADVAALATRGHVVSPRTSLLTVGPGERGDLGYGGWGIGSTCSACSFGTIGTGGHGRPSATEAITLAGPREACAERLGPDVDLSAVVTLEVTRAEIADVSVAAADPRVRSCLTEAVWSHHLSGAQARGPLETVVVRIP